MLGVILVCSVFAACLLFFVFFANHYSHFLAVWLNQYFPFVAVDLLAIYFNPYSPLLSILLAIQSNLLAAVGWLLLNS